MASSSSIPSGHILTPVSVGELVDKLTILQIKSERIAAPAKLANIHIELDRLMPLWLQVLEANVELEPLRAELKAINELMWDVQDALRDREKAQDFDEGFVRLACDVGRHNGVRMQVKGRINVLSGSQLQEVKQYRVDG